MVSVVICSISKDLAEQVKKNIDATIGLPWQFIAIDNSQLKKGITYVYNLGAGQAVHDIICFVHEDVLFQTPAWGRIIVNYFAADKRLGLVGIAGGKYKSRTVSGWWTGLSASDCCNVLFPDANDRTGRVYTNPDPSVTLQEVVTLDGVFLCARKEAWNKTPFDEDIITGFHFYDISFSFAVSANYKVAVTYEIDILHLKRFGDHDDEWLGYAFNWHNRHAPELPRTVAASAQNFSRQEAIVYKNWLNRLRYDKISITNRLRLVFYSAYWLKVRNWPYVAAFLVSGPAGKRRRMQRGR